MMISIAPHVTALVTGNSTAPASSSAAASTATSASSTLSSASSQPASSLSSSSSITAVPPTVTFFLAGKPINFAAPSIDFVQPWARADGKSPGEVSFRMIDNQATNTTAEDLIDLTHLKIVFSRQLPKMPREYIVRLMFDRSHRSLCLKKVDHMGMDCVIGGICIRPFVQQHFAEIVFCAVSSKEQVKGYGTLLMNRLKEVVKGEGITYFLTYADNDAVGYFKKQGFTTRISLPEERWRGYIKDYDGGTLMECHIHPKINYMDVRGMVQQQRDAVIEKGKQGLSSQLIYDGLTYFRQENVRVPIPISQIPGIPEFAWNTAQGGGDSISASASSGNLNIANNENNNQLGNNNISAANGASGSSLLPSGSDHSSKSALSFELRTPLQAQLHAILKQLRAVPDSIPFQFPVDANEVPDYYKLIKNPMDLLTMEHRIDSGHYKTYDMFRRDFQQILDNCRYFNPAKGPLCHKADIIERKFYEISDKVRSEHRP